MANDTLLERFVADLNGSVFFAEFAFSGSELTISGRGQIEIADHMVLLDTFGILFQLKERDATAPATAESLSAWFANKVRKKAVAQMRATRKTLLEHRGATIVNQRGHSVVLDTSRISELHSAIVFSAPIVEGFVPDRIYKSSSAGVMHFIRDVDYFGVCKVLSTPTEIAGYLIFRRDILAKFPEAASISEAALVGQYIEDKPESIPSERYALVLGALREDEAKWDLSYILENLGNNVAYREGDTLETSHYNILKEFAKLSRSELREFKLRFKLALEAVRDDRFELPYRFASVRTDCGFLIVPMRKQDAAMARMFLQTFSLVSKYEFDVSRHVSMSVVYASPMEIEWMFAEGPNPPNPEIDKKLATNYPFRKSSVRSAPRYVLDTDTLTKIHESGLD